MHSLKKRRKFYILFIINLDETFKRRSEVVLISKEEWRNLNMCLTQMFEESRKVVIINN